MSGARPAAPTAESPRRKAIRDTAVVALQRGGLVLSGVIFALVVPRLMGPAFYGQYDLLSSLCLWCIVASEFSLTVAVSRQGPAALRATDPSRMAALFGNVLLFRMAASLAAALLFWLLAARLAADIPATVRLFFAALVPAGAAAETLFSFMLGVDRAQRWGAGNLLRRWLGLAAVSAGFQAAGLPGAAAGLLACEIAVLALGAAWSRRLLTLRGLRPDGRVLGAALRLSAGFFVGAILQVTFRHGGETVLRLLGTDYREVAVFGLGMSIFTAADAALCQIFMAFTPSLSLLLLDGRLQEIRTWFEKLLETLAVPVAWVFLAALFLAGDVVPRAFGSGYDSLVPGAAVLGLMVIAAVPATGAWVLSIVLEQPALPARAGAVRLALFIAGAAALVPRWGGLGGLLAALLATATASLLLCRDVRRRFPFSPRRFLGIVAAAALFAPLALLKSSAAVNLLLCAAAVAGHGLLLVALGLLRAADFRALREAVSRKPR
jgi:O-antigen/teichoic acid export membrane protein